MEAVTRRAIGVLALDDEPVVRAQLVAREPQAVVTLVGLDVGAVGSHGADPAVEIEEQRPVVGMEREGDDDAAGVGVAALEQLELELVVDLLDACRSRFRFRTLEDVASGAALGSHRR